MIDWFTHELCRFFDEFTSTPEGVIDGGEVIVVPVNVKARAKNGTTIESFVPQSLIVPHAALMVSHAGLGMIIGALYEGFPMVLISIATDHPINAERAARRRVIVISSPLRFSISSPRDTIWQTPASPGYTPPGSGRSTPSFARCRLTAYSTRPSNLWRLASARSLACR